MNADGEPNSEPGRGDAAGANNAKHKATVAGDSARVLLGSLGTQVLGVIKGLALPVIISPTQYGLWRLLLLVWQNGAFVHLGSYAYLAREVPGLLATSRAEEAARIRRVSLSGSLGIATLVAVGLVVWSFVVGPSWSTEARWALRLTAAGLIAQQAHTYQTYVMRATLQFGRMAISRFANAALGLALMLALAPVWGVPGLALGMLIAYSGVLGFVLRWVPLERATWQPRAFGRIAASGAVLTSFPFMNNLMGSVGAVVCASALGLAETGYYGVGLMLGTVVYAVPRALTTVLYPRYLERVAVSGDASGVGSLMRRSLLVTSTLAPIVVAGCAVLIEAVFRTWLTEYLPGLEATYLLLAMMAFMSLAVIVQDAILALRKHWPLLILQGCAVLLTGGLALAGLHAVGGVVGVAMGVAAGNTLFGITVLVAALRWTAGPGDNPWREAIAFLAPTVVMGATAWLALRWGTADADAFATVVRTTVRATMLALVGGGLLWIRLRHLRRPTR